MVSLFRKRRRSTQSIRKVELEPTFRDLVIKTARLVALSGYRQVVPLSQNGYYRLFTEAKASVVEKNRKYSLREGRIFEEAAQIVLNNSTTRFRHMIASANRSRDEDGREGELRLFIRSK